MVSRFWKQLKVWRRISLGPLSLRFRFERSVDVSRNTRQRLKTALHRHHSWANVQVHQGTAAEHPLPNRGAQSLEELAVIVGVGPGFGYALAKRLASEGLAVVLVSRNAERLDLLAEEIAVTGGIAFAYGCDATSEASVVDLFAHIEAQHGVPNLVVYSLQSFGPGQTIDIELPAFEDAWRHNCLGAFLVARSAARSMLTKGRGTIVLTGSTSSMLGRAGHLNLAVGKFGQRALAQVLARELWPKGIHVAHLVIDADIHEGVANDDGGPQSDPNHISEVVVSLHRQPRTAWTSEVDVRPFNEQFWEHC